MRLKTNRNQNTLELAGRVDAETAPQLETEIDSIIDNANSLVIDMKDLEYISSAGLRVILKAHKALSEAEGLKLINVSKTVMEVFKITGFTDFLSLEPTEEEIAGTYYRRMSVSDIPDVKALIGRALLDEKVQFIHEDFENDAWIVSYDLGYLTRIAEHYHAYLMFEDQTDTLVASGYIKLDDDAKCAFVGMLFSDPAFRHLKLGSKMLKILENDSYAEETKKIILNSSMSAFRFYQKMGYNFPNGEFELMQDDDGTYGMTLEKDL
jgi:anti-sigma B factor antagonist